MYLYKPINSLYKHWKRIANVTSCNSYVNVLKLTTCVIDLNISSTRLQIALLRGPSIL